MGIPTGILKFGLPLVIVGALIVTFRKQITEGASAFGGTIGTSLTAPFTSAISAASTELGKLGTIPINFPKFEFLLGGEKAGVDAAGQSTGLGSPAFDPLKNLAQNSLGLLDFQKLGQGFLDFFGNIGKTPTAYAESLRPTLISGLDKQSAAIEAGIRKSGSIAPVITSTKLPDATQHFYVGLVG